MYRNKNVFIGTAAVLALIILGGPSSFAAEANPQLDNLEQRVAEVEKELAGQKGGGGNIGSADSGLKISGFLDGSYLYAKKQKTSTFSLDEVEIDIEKEVTSDVMLRTDINFREVDDDDGSLVFNDIVEQGFMAVSTGDDTELTFTFGKFNAPIGFELLDPPDMFQYSHALVFDLGLPTNVTGLMASSELSDEMDLAVYLVNGWDNNTDNNRAKTIGARLGVTPDDDMSLGFSSIWGAEADSGNKRWVFDVDGAIESIEDVLLGFEVNYGWENAASGLRPGNDANWFGLLLMTNIVLTDDVGLTVRYDYFDDFDAARTGYDTHYNAVAISPNYQFTDGCGILAEYRVDWSSKRVYDTSDPNRLTKQLHTVALEMTFLF